MFLSDLGYQGECSDQGSTVNTQEIPESDSSKAPSRVQSLPPPSYKESQRLAKSSLTELVQSSIQAIGAPAEENDCGMKRNTLNHGALELAIGTLNLSKQRPREY